MSSNNLSEFDLPLITSTVENLVQLHENLKDSSKLKARLNKINELASEINSRDIEEFKQIKGKNVLQIIEALMKQISDKIKLDDDTLTPEQFQKQLDDVIELVNLSLGVKDNSTPNTISGYFNKLFGTNKKLELPTTISPITLPTIKNTLKKKLTQPEIDHFTTIKTCYSINQPDYIITVIEFFMSSIQLLLIHLLWIDKFYFDNDFNKTGRLHNTTWFFNYDKEKADIATRKLNDISNLTCRIITIMMDRFKTLKLKEFIDPIISKCFLQNIQIEISDSNLKDIIDIVYRIDQHDEIFTSNNDIFIHKLLNIRLFYLFLEKFSNKCNINYTTLYEDKEYIRYGRIIKMLQPRMVSSFDGMTPLSLSSPSRLLSNDLPLFLMFNQQTLNKNIKKIDSGKKIINIIIQIYNGIIQNDIMKNDSIDILNKNKDDVRIGFKEYLTSLNIMYNQSHMIPTYILIKIYHHIITTLIANIECNSTEPNSTDDLNKSIYLLMKMILICNPPYKIASLQHIDSKIQELLDQQYKIVDTITPKCEDIHPLLLQMIDIEEQISKLVDTTSIINSELIPSDGSVGTNLSAQLDKFILSKDINTYILDFIQNKNKHQPFEKKIGNISEMIITLTNYKLKFIYNYELHLIDQFLYYELINKMMDEQQEELRGSILPRFMFSV